MQKVEVARGIQELHDLGITAILQRRLQEPVRLSFGKNHTKPVLAHRNQLLAGAHEIGTFKTIEAATWSCGNVKDEHSPIRMQHYLNVHPEPKGLEYLGRH